MVMRGGYSYNPSIDIYMVAVGDPMKVLFTMNQAIDLTVRQTPMPIAKEIARIAKSKAKVGETGDLRRSIGFRPAGKNSYEVYADVPYAVYVEYGTYKMAAQPFLRPAIDEVNGTGIMADSVWNNKVFEAAMHTPVIRKLDDGGGLADLATLGITGL